MYVYVCMHLYVCMYEWENVSIINGFKNSAKLCVYINITNNFLEKWNHTYGYGSKLKARGTANVGYFWDLDLDHPILGMPKQKILIMELSQSIGTTTHIDAWSSLFHENTFILMHFVGVPC